MSNLCVMIDYTGNSDTTSNIWLDGHFHGYLSQPDASCKDEWIVRLYEVLVNMHWNFNEQAQ